VRAVNGRERAPRKARGPNILTAPATAATTRTTITISTIFQPTLHEKPPKRETTLGILQPEVNAKVLVFVGRVAACELLRYDWGMSFGDTAFIFVLALLIFGPKKLPEIARQVGKWLNEFKRASNEFKAQIESEINQLELQEKQKKAEQEQKILPPAEPPPGVVHSSHFSSSPENSSEPPVPAGDVNSPAHDTTNA
jgi:Tat protein translocase TatB subunit